MREAILILLVIAVLLALTAFRYRKQIAAVMNVWRMLKSARQAGTETNKQVQESKTASGPLVSCVKCGTWVPQSRGIKLGKASFYCSSDCVERSAKPA